MSSTVRRAVRLHSGETSGWECPWTFLPKNGRLESGLKNELKVIQTEMSKKGIYSRKKQLLRIM